jgi:hypothetical protein
MSFAVIVPMSGQEYEHGRFEDIAGARAYQSLLWAHDVYCVYVRPSDLPPNADYRNDNFVFPNCTIDARRGPP